MVLWFYLGENGLSSTVSNRSECAVVGSRFQDCSCALIIACTEIRDCCLIRDVMLIPLPPPLPSPISAQEVGNVVLKSGSGTSQKCCPYVSFHHDLGGAVIIPGASLPVSSYEGVLIVL